MSGAAPRIGSREYFDRLREVEDRHWWSRGMRADAAALLGPLVEPPRERPWRVLDAGCGTGVTLAWAEALARGGARRMVGVDLSPHALAYCRSRGQRDIARASVLELPFREREFDLVLCLDVLQHLPRPDGDERALRECLRVLRPGGILFVRSNARRAGESFAESDYQRYDLGDLRRLLEGAGFGIERLTYANALSAWLEKLRPRREAHHHHGHGAADQGLKIRCLPPALAWANPILLGLLTLEARYLGAPGRSLAAGHSTMAVARRPPR